MLFISPRTVLVIGVFFLGTACSGCDAIYRMLQKEGAEEKDILGVVVATERHPEVEQIQKLLRLYGYRVGRPDGILGANTRNAIGAFQVDNNLEVTRFVDQATWKELNKFEKYGLVVDGDLNIAAVQVAVDASGIKLGKIDGKLGKRTKQAIREFQKAEGLKPDGVVGYQTLTALSRYLLPMDDA